MLIHFPLAYECVIEEADALLEKNYVDHAIILLENFLETAVSKPGVEAIRKKLLSCYLLKEDLESAESIILQLTQSNCLDLSTVAHHIIIAQWQGTDSELLAYYKDKLRLAPSSTANLLALVYELKEFYEQEWLGSAQKLFQRFFEAKDLEEAMDALGSLDGVDARYFSLARDRFEAYLDADSPRLHKAMLYFLWLEHEQEPFPMLEGITITAAMQKAFQDRLAQGLARVEDLGLDLNLAQILKQHLYLFYHSLFPHDQNLSQDAVLYWLGKVALNLELSEILEISGNLCPKDNVIEEKVREYMASLSL